MATRDLILTTLHRLRFESVEPFFRSLKATGYNGQVVAFVSAMDQESLAQLRKNGATVVPFHFSGKHVGQRMARAWFLWRSIFQRSRSDSFKEQLAHTVFHLFYRRHLLYLQFLRDHRNDYDRIFLTDCRDVYFQADPFSWNPSPGIHLFLEEANHTIGKCPHHIRWIKSQFGQEALDAMAADTVCCAGTTFGSMEGVIDYLSTMVSTTMRALSLRESDGDQGIHNYVLRKGLIPNAVVHDNREGPVMTLAPISMSSLRFNEEGVLVNNRDEIVPVLHQYDRIVELKTILLDRLEKLGNPIGKGG